MTPAVDREYVVETLRALVRINSVNPALVPGAPGEAEIAAEVTGRLAALGLDVRRHEETPGRPSVVGTWRGAESGRSLMLNAHMDTVGVDGMTEPFSAAIRDGRLFGRGANDMKGALAACLGAVKALRDAGIRLKGDLQIAAVADEEHASLGMQEVLRYHRPNGAIVTEPTGLATCLAHKGFIWFTVTTTGRAYHGSRFDQGIDANMRMGRFLARLEELERELRQRTPHPLVGPPSLHAATLSGGSGWSTYSAHCRLGIERRTVPGESSAQARAEIQELLDRLAQADASFQADLAVELVREPFSVAPEAAVVQAVDGAVRSVRGLEPVHSGDTVWMDAAFLAAAGVETVVIGPTGGGSHADEEWVDLDSVIELAAILAEAAQRYCGTVSA